MELSKVKKFVVELLALVFEYLVCIFFPTAHSLELREIFAARQHLFELRMLFFVSFELCADTFKRKCPLVLEKIVLFKAGAYVSFVLFVVLSNLRFSFLKNFDFETSLSRPLLA